jgi:hypothetical protein
MGQVGGGGVSNFAYINSGQANGVTAVSGVASATVIVGFGPPPPPPVGNFLITLSGNPIVTLNGQNIVVT